MGPLLLFKDCENDGDQMADEQTITIDGKDYLISDLTDDAKAQLGNLKVVDQKIANLKQEIAIMKTARNAYARALGAALPKDA